MGYGSLEYVNCNLCGAYNAQILYPSTLSEGLPSNKIERFRCTSSSYGKHYTIVKCRNCGLIYANPRPEGAIIRHNYEDVVDRAYLEERQGRVLTFKRNFRPLEQLAESNSSGRKLLDLGCHIGIFLEIAQKRGWDAWGVELSHWAAMQARNRGLHVIQGTLAEANFADKSFDVVTMWDVIEHLTDPTSELREVNRILKPGGLICIHTMNIESPFAKLMGSHWPWLMEMHLYYFSPQTLTQMLEKTGFQVVRQFTQGRFLRLGYLISRLEPYSRIAARGMGRLVKALRLEKMPVPINLGDLFTTYARKINELPVAD